MDVSLEGKVALVTGASRGIGQAVAATMAASGAKVMLTSRKLDQLKEVQAEMEGDVDVIASHVGDADSGEKTVAATIERFGSLDILVTTLAPTRITGRYLRLIRLDGIRRLRSTFAVPCSGRLLHIGPHLRRSRASLSIWRRSVGFVLGRTSVSTT